MWSEAITKYENGEYTEERLLGSYQAEYWNYTEEGYLMFSGVWFSEELYVLTLSGAEEHTALRVQPLDETYRELSRKYLLPISFERNNMFIVDWSEEDFGDLNFYDMYDILYPKVNGQYVPYVADDNLSVSAVYRIPKEEFESVIMKYFNIDSETLQSKTVYDSEDSTYEYKPRGFEEVEYPEYPYSEVIGYTENSDGTITLTANVVFPYSGNSKVYAHEVVVRPLEDGGVQYVSNRIIPSEDNSEETWHTPRLTVRGMGRTVWRRMMEDVKWLLEEMGIFDFGVVNCGNYRSDLLGESCTRKNGRWQRKYGSLRRKSGTVKQITEEENEYGNFYRVSILVYSTSR